jgi:hypothetical protein
MSYFGTTSSTLKVQSVVVVITEVSVDLMPWHVPDMIRVSIASHTQYRVLELMWNEIYSYQYIVCHNRVSLQFSSGGWNPGKVRIFHNVLIKNYVDQDPTWEAKSNLVNQEIPWDLWNLKVLCRAHKFRLLVRNLRQMNSIQTFPNFNTNFNIILSFMIRFLKIIIEGVTCKHACSPSPGDFCVLTTVSEQSLLPLWSLQICSPKSVLIKLR